MVVTNSTTLQQQATQPQPLQMPVLQQSTHSFLREAAAVVDGSAQVAAQEDFFQPRAHSQALTRLQSARGEQQAAQDPLRQMVVTLSSILLQQLAEEVAAPPLTTVHQAAVVVAAATIITVAPVLQVKALQEETIHLGPVLEVVVLDRQVSPLQVEVLETLLAVMVDLDMVERLFLCS